MKNKEIEELLNMLKKCAREEKATLKPNEIACKTILSYIEQLENNRDKAIRTLETLKGSARWEAHLYEVDYILDILKGDSDESRI